MKLLASRIEGVILWRRDLPVFFRSTYQTSSPRQMPEKPCAIPHEIPPPSSASKAGRWNRHAHRRQGRRAEAACAIEFGSRSSYHRFTG